VIKFINQACFLEEMANPYHQTLEEYLAKAQHYSQQGEVVGMLICLESARICAGKCGREITDVSREIEYSGYSRAIPVLLEEARTFALKRDLKRMYLSFRESQMYAAKIGEDISDTLEEIKYLTLN